MRHCQLSTTQRRPAAPIRGGPVGVGQQVADRRRDRADVPAVDHQPGLAVDAPFPVRRPDRPATTGTPVADASR